MVCPTLISLDQFTHYQSPQVGLRGVEFGKLFTQGIPLPEMFCIPHETLLSLVRENQLDKKLEQLLPHTGPEDANTVHLLKVALTTEIRNQQLPQWFAQELTSVYHRVFHRSFVRFLPGEKLSHFDESKFQHIHGDANLLESFLACWAETVAARLNQHLHIHSLILAPVSILLQAQYEPLVSGVASTQAADTSMKNQVMLSAIWGGPDRDLLDNTADHFWVDVRTWHVTHREIAEKPKQYRRIPDGREVSAVPAHYHSHPSLSDEQASTIAQIAFTIKQHNIIHQDISWELTREGVFVTDVQESIFSEPSRSVPFKKTITKLFISTGNPYKQTHVSPLVDGVGVLRSEYTLAKFGIHPQHVIHSSQKAQLQKELVATIKAYQDSAPSKPLFYRSQNFTSSELRQLKYSESYEPREPNPYLGYRGGLQLWRQPELLHFELEVLKQAVASSRGSLSYLLSFIRTPAELEFVLHEITKSGLFSFPQFSVWWQLNTPDNSLNLAAYPTQKLAGLSVNVKSIQSLLLGIDPDNPEIYEHYMLETQSIIQQLAHVADTVKELNQHRSAGNELKLNLHLEDYSHELVASAVKFGYYGVVVKPAMVQITHDCLLDTEHVRLTRLP